MDLISVVWEVRPERAASLPRWLGYAVYGVVLRRLAERDAARAGEVHEAEGPSGLTCSTLMGPREGEAVDPGRVYRLRVTAYRPELAPLIDPEEGALWGEGERIELEGVPFRVERVIREGDPWAGWTTYEELIARYGRTPRAWPREVALQFTSPTAFRDGERWNPLPVPEAVFGHLMEKWNRFAPAVLPEALREMVAARVGVARFDLSSRAVRVKEGVRIGCVGQVRYRVLGEDRYLQAMVHLLAEFARYAGVGILTGMGMGQARALREEERPEPEAEA
jgi:CRISPR-associated endoribonuclease Cas6